ncbi:MAG: hypothetical protein ACOY4T_13765 [Pseudomonadota bacterium]
MNNDPADGYAWKLPLFLWLSASVILIAALDRGAAASYGWIIAILWSGLCFAAILGMADGPSRAYIAASLEKPGIARGYAISTRQRLEDLWKRYGTSAEGSLSLIVSFRRSLTWKLYDAAMLVAVVYPTLVLVGWWIITGDEARIGDSAVLPRAQFWPDRSISLIGMLFFAASIPLSWQAASRPDDRSRNLARWLPVLGATIATAGVLSAFNALAAGLGLALGFLGGAAIAGAGSVVVVGAAAVIGAAAVAIATASTMMGIGLVPIMISILLVVTMAVALDTLDGQGRHALARLVVTFALPVGWILSLILIPFGETGTRPRGLFLFLAVFPLVNALFSVVSYAANLALARQGLLTGRILVNGLAGLAVSLLVSALLGLGFAVMVALLDLVAGPGVFRLASVFAAIALHPDLQEWLILTVLTPLAPTALHAAIALVGATTFVPRPIRSGVARLIRAAGTPQKHRAAASAAVPFMLGTLWLVPFLGIAVAGWIIWFLAGGAIKSLLWAYVFLVRDLAFALTGA